MMVGCQRRPTPQKLLDFMMRMMMMIKTINNMIMMIMIMMIINDGWMPTSAAPNWDSAAKASQLPKAY